MLYAEMCYFEKNHCAHVAAHIDHQRLQRIDARCEKHAAAQRSQVRLERRFGSRSHG